MLALEVVPALEAHLKVQTAERLAAGTAWQNSGHVLTHEAGEIGEPYTPAKQARKVVATESFLAMKGAKLARSKTSCGAVCSRTLGASKSCNVISSNY
jgi:hypothetical protein